MKKCICLILCILFSTVPVGAFTAEVSDESVLFTENKSENFDKTFSLSGIQSEDIVRVAEKQLEKTKSDLDYTEAWCANFVGDCAILANIGRDIIPYYGGCTGMVSRLLDSLKAKEVETPQRGDLVFYWCNSCKSNSTSEIKGCYVHVGIVSSSNMSIQGNYSNKVSSVSLSTPFKDSEGHYCTQTYIRPNYTVNTNVNISSPANNSWQDPRKDIVITWNAMEAAAGYRVAVKCDSGIHEGEKPYNNVWTTDTSFTIPYGTLYHNERYKIWVGGYESKSASEAITAGDSISINIMSGPQIISPDNGYEYAHPANTTIAWSAVESADSYIIKLVNTATGEVLYNNKNIGNKLSYKFTGLDENTEYKFAVGTNDGWWSQGDFYFSTSRFPVITNPVNNEVYDSESITVKWSGVPGAEDYRLILKDASGNVINGYNEVSTNGKTSYELSGLNKGETYKVNVYGVINEGSAVQEFWSKETVMFTVSDDADDTEGEAITLAWRDYENGDVKEYSIDSSSARPARPYAFFFETNSSETPLISVSDSSVIKAVLYDSHVTVTCIGEGNAVLNLSVEEKSITLKFIVTDTAETTLCWKDYENGYIYECSVDIENAIFARPFVLYYETNSAKTPVLTVSDEAVIKASIDKSCVSISYVGAGEAVLTLSLDGVSISFTIIVSDVNEDVGKDSFDIEMEEDDSEVRFNINTTEECVIYVAECGNDNIMTSVSQIPMTENDSITVAIFKTGKERLFKIFVWSKELEPFTEVMERVIK